MTITLPDRSPVIVCFGGGVDSRDEPPLLVRIMRFPAPDDSPTA